MRKLMLPMALLPALLLAGVRAYDVAPARDLNGWSRASPYPSPYVTQEIRCIFDSALYAEAFIGQVGANHWYHFELDDATGNKVYQGDTMTLQGWTWVRAYLHRYPANPMPPKGSDLILKVSATAQDDSVNWYASDGDPWAYGRMHVPGREVPGNYDLAARLVGLAWNRHEMISFYDLVPCHIWDRSDSDGSHSRHIMHAELCSLALAAQAERQMGGGATRFIDVWGAVQPDANNPDSFDWTYVDSAMLALVQNHVRPSNVMIQGFGQWPATETSAHPSGRRLPQGDFPWVPSNLFYDVGGDTFPGFKYGDTSRIVSAFSANGWAECSARH